jgi:hypothetical protein
MSYFSPASPLKEKVEPGQHLASSKGGEVFSKSSWQETCK